VAVEEGMTTTVPLAILTALSRLDRRGLLGDVARIARARGVSLELVLAGEQGTHQGRGDVRIARAEIVAHLRDVEGLSVSAAARLLGIDRWTAIRDLRAWDGGGG
jgi:transcriptional regulator of acetoin/glycerol metabolism